MSPLNSYNVCFLGRTGNGKTSLINALFDTHFPTDPHVSSTKEMYTVSIVSNKVYGFDAIKAIDTPGIGEFSTNSKYKSYYECAVNEANCVVLVMTFDRTDAPIQRLLISLKHIFDKREKIKFVIALNHIDSRIITGVDNAYQPWDNKNNCPTDDCVKNIAKRISILRNRLDTKILGDYQIVPVCAIRNYGIERLREEIIMSKI